MTPAEGAFFLGVPNIIMVQSSTTEAKYGRLEPPFAQYMYALRPLKRVVWSVVGSGGFSDPQETEEVLDLAKTQPSFVGAMLDDFFTGRKDGQRAKWTVDELAQFRRRLLAINKDFKIFATYYYASQVDLPLGDYLDLIDVVTLWCGPKDVVNLEANLKRAEASAPKCKKMLGCYVVDYGGKQRLARRVDEAPVRDGPEVAPPGPDRRDHLPRQYDHGPGLRVGRMGAEVDRADRGHSALRSGPIIRRPNTPPARSSAWARFCPPPRALRTGGGVPSAPRPRPEKARRSPPAGPC